MMFNWQELLLLAGVVVAGTLHTAVPDHWAPIALLARQRGWSRLETARAALQAGAGHVATTLLFGIAAWFVGATTAAAYGQIVDTVASIALIAFGSWIAVGAWREAHAPEGESHGGHGHVHHRGSPHHHSDEAKHSVAVVERHAHFHRHGEGIAHYHWHDHGAASAHATTADMAFSPPAHSHSHKTSGRMALLLVLGSSPMVESIPAFFAASRYGIGLIITMSLAFAATTIGTYVVLSVYASSGLQRLRLGPIERYGEVISGAFIALIGIAFGLWALI